MKKTQLLGTILSALFLPAAFLSCSDEYDLTVDTIVTLDRTDNVKASSFFGGNYVTWDAVRDADSYKIFRIENADTNAETTEFLGTSTNNYYADVVSSSNLLTNGTSYKYEVVASGPSSSQSSSGANSAVFVRDSDARRSETAVIANIPTFGTSVTSPAATLSLGNANVLVSFTQTAGFSYKFYLANASDLAQKSVKDAFQEYGTGSASVNTVYADASSIAKVFVSGSGVKDVLVKVSSVSSLYEDVYADLGSVTIPSIGEATETNNVNAQYVSATSVLVSWKPAVLTSGEKAPTSDYKVYREADSVWTQVSGTVSSGVNSSNSTTYSITDTVSANNIAYTYYVVLTDGTSFGTTKSIDLAKYSADKTEKPTLTVTTYVDGTDGKSDTIKITATKANSNQKLTLYYKKLAEDSDGNKIEAYFDSFTKLDLENENGLEDSYISYIKDADEGTYLFRLKAEEDGKKDASDYDTIAVNGADVDTNSLSVSYDSSTVDGTTTYSVTVSDSINTKTDSLSNYTYTLYKVVTKREITYYEYVTVETSKVADLTLTTDDTTTSTYKTYTKATTVDKKAESTSDEYVSTTYYVVKALASDSTVSAKESE